MWWREHFSQSKFKDNIESLNTNDVLSVIQEIEKENASFMKPKFQSKMRCLLGHYLLWNLNIENMYSAEKDSTVYANQSKRQKQSGNNANVVLNDFTDLESESAKNMFDAIFLWIVPIMQFWSWQRKQR